MHCPRSGPPALQLRVRFYGATALGALHQGCIASAWRQLYGRFSETEIELQGREGIV